jgi:hypothetical protein
MVPTLNGVRASLPVLYRAHMGCLCLSNTLMLMCAAVVDQRDEHKFEKQNCVVIRMKG